MRPSIIPLFLDVSKYIVTGVISDTLPKPFYTIRKLMALVVFCLSFYFVFSLTQTNLSLASIMSMCSFEVPLRGSGRPLQPVSLTGYLL